MCACTEPVRTGIGAVCVEYGRPKWPITMLNHTRVQKMFRFDFWHPMLVRPAMKRLFCMKAKNGLGRFAPSVMPHYYTPPQRMAFNNEMWVVGGVVRIYYFGVFTWC